ncbi:uncharacterized protein MYCFIDRAFT_177827 [Pseudocercospora fijiensis CIRAD86]|uniref:Uncharacterized protein n=1 Tax=Pseudocercospora fijiensis (strain CIRAD86) TaxID=383855 RepID=M2YN98_PSEFD|nr:uncharacterized protein MYCFIDRAFT_177827 [Pseudocercospora fijiensis CIRAD86]EME79185.1 hypothetical protein MYCFIDRAFT_177827 [Pseudocercospora fijiensis CIRAD86]
MLNNIENISRERGCEFRVVVRGGGRLEERSEAVVKPARIASAVRRVGQFGAEYVFYTSHHALCITHHAPRTTHHPSRHCGASGRSDQSELHKGLRPSTGLVRTRQDGEMRAARRAYNECHATTESSIKKLNFSGTSSAATPRKAKTAASIRPCKSCGMALPNYKRCDMEHDEEAEHAKRRPYWPIHFVQTELIWLQKNKRPPVPTPSQVATATLSSDTGVAVPPLPQTADPKAKKLLAQSVAESRAYGFGGGTPYRDRMMKQSDPDPSAPIDPSDFQMEGAAPLLGRARSTRKKQHNSHRNTPWTKSIPHRTGTRIEAEDTSSDYNRPPTLLPKFAVELWGKLEEEEKDRDEK